MEWQPYSVTKHQWIHTIQTVLHHSVRLAHFEDPILDMLFISVLV